MTEQKPDATLVAGYTVWQRQVGRQVQKGETGIRILAPTPYKKRMEVEKTDPNTGEILMNPDGSMAKEMREDEMIHPWGFLKFRDDGTIVIARIQNIR